MDGAYHYLQGLPLWSSSLALIREGSPVFAMIYDPTRSELFMAAEGMGARLNGTPLTVGTQQDLSGTVLETAVAPILQVGAEEHDRALAMFNAVSRQVFVIRQMASASLQVAYVAFGRLDGYWEIGDDIPDWLAGAFLVREAGGIVTDLSWQAFDWTAKGILATTPALHSVLHHVLEGVSHPIT